MERILVFTDVIHDKNTSKYHRRTGFSLPLHIYQVVTVLLTFGVAFCHFYIILPISIFNNAVFYVISSVLFFLIVAFYLVVTLIDPVDRNAAIVIYNEQGESGPVQFSKIMVDSYEKGKPTNTPNVEKKDLKQDGNESQNTEVNTSKHVTSQRIPQVIPSQMSHCNVCNFVDPSSKHCNVCNKCVTKFDHHCVWVNNCIGIVNYQFFIWLLFFSLAFLTYNYVLTFYIVFSFKEISKWHENFRRLVYNGSISYFNGFLYGIAAFTLIPFLFILYLFSFHLFLISTKQTTYQYYIKRMEQLEAEKSKSKSTSKGFFDFLIIKKKKRKSSQDAKDGSELK